MAGCGDCPWTAGNESSAPARALASLAALMDDVMPLARPLAAPLTGFERDAAAVVARSLLATVQRYPLRQPGPQFARPLWAAAPPLGATEHDIANDIVRALTDAGMLRQPSLAQRLRNRARQALRRGDYR